MSSKKHILDVTLRETPTFLYGAKNIKNTLTTLENAEIDIIECAFLGSENAFTFCEGSTHVNTVEQANSLVTKKKKGVIYTLCVNGSSYDFNRIPNATPEGVDAFRYVLIENKFNEEIEDIKIIKEKGYKVFVQHRNIISYTDEEILCIVKKINELGVEAYSIVDTHGSLYHKDIARLVRLIMPVLNKNIWFGYHGHNNHMLANSNAEFFLDITEERQDVFVDSSIMGAGIGAGNANTELIALYLNKWENANYKINYIYDFIDEVIPDLKKRCLWGYSEIYLVTGENNAVITHGRYLQTKLQNAALNHINELLENMPSEYRYMDNMAYWNDYAGLFIKESKVLVLRRRLYAMKCLEPLKKVYLKILEVKNRRLSK